MPIRITGGTFRGRFIPSPQGEGTRPTAALAREALFNILQDVSGYTVLDLFAGTGVVGLEAVSRDASMVYAVEMRGAQSKLIQKAYESLGVSDKLRMITKNAVTLCETPSPVADGFDLIYADPPFTEAYPDLRGFFKWLKPGGYAVFEVPSRAVPEWAPEEAVRRYGESSLAFFRAPA